MKIKKENYNNLAYYICPDHGLVEFGKGEVSIMDGEPFCTIKRCSKDVIVINILKNCLICGNVMEKSEKEIKKEIRKYLKRFGLNKKK